MAQGDAGPGRSLAELPSRVRLMVMEAEPSQPEVWANSPIPALGGRSVFDLYDQEGEDAVYAFALEVAGKFG